MRDFNLTYIPDLTERFPEGFDGVDMTPYRYDPAEAFLYNDNEEIPYEMGLADNEEDFEDF